MHLQIARLGVFRKMLKVFVFLGVLFSEGVCGIENQFANEIETFVSSLMIGENCKRDFSAYLNGIISGEFWALEMLDSMEKFPTGLLLGRTTAAGQPQECLSVVHPNFTGQHCTVDLSPKKLKPNPKIEHLKFKETKGRSIGTLERIVNRDFGYGVCIPSTCNSTELQTIITAAGVNEFLSSKVSESDCRVTLYQELRVKDYIAMGALFSVVLIAVISTICDVYTEKDEAQNTVFKSFSLYSNYKILFHINKKTAEMSALNGVRFLSMSWVVLGHYFFIDYLFGDFINNIEKYEIRNKISTIFLTNAFVSVDSFFFMSGLLVCFVFFRDISSKGYYDAPAAIIHRYFRLSMPVAVIFLIHVTFFSRMISAPFSKPALDIMEEHCRKYWWTFFLYIQNFYEESRKCIPQAWYLGADMQMFLLSPLVMYVVYFWKKCATKYLALLAVVSSVISLVVCYKYDLSPNHAMDLYNGIKSLEYFYFYTRMAPWFVGIATGCILCGIRAKKIKFQPTRVWVIIGWLTSAFLCLSCLYGLAPFLPFESEHSALEKSLYRSFHRLGWSLGLAWVVLACVGGYGGPINAFLSLDIFQPLAKLSYCVYLVHISVQKYRYFQYSRFSERADYYALAYSYILDLTISFVLAIPMTLLFEMPFTHLSKIFFGNLTILPYPRVDKTKQSGIFCEKPKPLDLEKGVESK